MQLEALTRREREVMEHLSDGVSSAVVAGRLFISKRTVDFHMDNIYKKYNTHNRIAAVLKYLREKGQ